MLDKDLLEIKEEIYKCSKCGLCQSVCPLFLATKNEMFSPRGRFIVLNNHINNNVELTKDFINNLNFCLNCNLCKDFCPSNINTSAIISALKQKYLKKNFSILRKIKIFYFLNSILKNLSMCFPFNLILKNSLYKNNIKRYKNKKLGSNVTKRVIFFEGCYNKYINSSDKNAVLNILEKMGYEVNTLSLCCGYPYFVDGDIDRLKSNFKNLISQITDDCDYIICSCDTCFETLKLIKEFIPNSMFDFENKLIRFDDFLCKNNVSIPIDNDVLYFSSLLRKKKNSLFAEKQISSKKGVCSLMENFLLLRYPKETNVISSKIDFSQIENTDVKVVTTCNISRFGLKKIFKKMNLKNKIYSFSEYLLEKTHNLY